MRALLFALCLVLPVGTAHSEIRWAYVLEYWVDISPHIGVYQVESAAAHPQTEDHMQFLLHNWPGSPRSDYELLDVGVRLVRSLRGTPAATLSVVCSAYTKSPKSTPLKFDVKDQFLVFWWESAAGEAFPTYIICLTKPPANKYGTMASDGLDPAIRPDCTILKDGKSIEQVVKQRIATNPQPKHLSIGKLDESMARIDIHEGTDAYQAFDDLSGVFLIMPKELVPAGLKAIPNLVPGGKGSPSLNIEEEEEVVTPLNVPTPKPK